MSDIAIALVDVGRAHDYYYTTEWVRTQQEVMDKYRRECIRCKWLKGTYNKAYILHHVHRLKGEPQYAATPLLEPTVEEREQIECIETWITQYFDGRFYDIACLSDKYREKYYIKQMDKVIQLLPLCRNCHKEVHGRVAEPRVGSLDEKFPELL